MRFLAALLLLILVTSGCSSRNGTGPVQSSCESGSFLFTLERLPDPRIPGGDWVEHAFVREDRTVFSTHVYVKFNGTGRILDPNHSMRNITPQRYECVMKSLGRWDALRDYEVQDAFEALVDERNHTFLKQVVEARMPGLDPEYTDPECEEPPVVVAGNTTKGVKVVVAHCLVQSVDYQQVMTAYGRVVAYASVASGVRAR